MDGPGRDVGSRLGCFVARPRAGSRSCSFPLFCNVSTAADRKVELQGDPSFDLFLTGANVYLVVLLQVKLNESFVPTKCRWCEPPGFDANLRDALKWKNPRTAGTVTDIAAFGVAPASAFGLTALAAAHDDRADEIAEDSLYIAEAATTSVLVSQLAKGLAARQRPAVYYRAERENDFSAREKNSSFFSGHASTSFTLAVSSGTLASMRGYSWAPMVWAVGLTNAAVAAYGRAAADAHWTSDIVIGSAIGAGIGFALPHFLHPPLERDADTSRNIVLSWHPTVIPVEGGAGVGVSGVL